MGRLVVLLVLLITSHNVASQFQNSSNLLNDILGNQSNSIVNDVLSSVFVLNDNANTSIVSTILADIVNEFGEDDICIRQLSMFYASLGKMDEWALIMFDATAKIQSGLLEGNTMQIGNYDECLNIDVRVNESQIYGQYCTVYMTEGVDNRPIIETVLSIHFSHGLCLPYACNTTTLGQIALLIEKNLNSSQHLNFRDEFCSSTVNTKPFSAMSIVSLIFFTSMGFIVVTSTVYDIYICHKRKNNDPNLLTAFSFYTNGRKLFSTKRSADSLGCLNGLRVISMVWILGAHRYMYIINIPFINFLELMQLYKTVKSAFISAANMGVDTFFVVSGLLIVYVYVLNKEKGRVMTLPMFYIHRILRLTPALAAMVLFQSTLMERIGSGPFWTLIYNKYQSDCERTWWATLLYIQNYLYPDDKCVIQSWYLAVDTQLYFLSPLLLIPLIKWPKRTLSVVVCLTLVCCVVASGISWLMNLEPAFINLPTDVFQYLYAATYVRASVWLVGFILGYVLFQLRNTVIRINKLIVVLLWIGSVTVLTVVVLYHKRIASPENMTRLEHALVNSLLRLAWALALSVVIFLCAVGYGGAINRILSSSVFTVLIRINYSVYLVHLLVIMCHLMQIRTPGHFSYIDNFYYFWGDWAISSILGTVWTLTFESPIIILEKLMFGRRQRKEDDRVKPEKYNNNISVLVVHNNLGNSKP